MDKTNDLRKQTKVFMEQKGIKWDIKFIGCKPYFTDDKDARDVYRLRLQRGEEKARFTFGQSMANTGDGINPALADIVYCLMTDYDAGGYSLNDFAREFYGETCKITEVLKIWSACKRNKRKLDRLFTFEEIETLRALLAEY